MTETVRSKPVFRDAYRKRRCIVPVEGFFEWQATKGGKQPYAIAMKNGAPFGLAGLWENWKDPASGDWVRGGAAVFRSARSYLLCSRLRNFFDGGGRVEETRR